MTEKPKVTFSINEEDVEFTANMVVCSGCASGFAISVYGDEAVSYCPCCGSEVRDVVEEKSARVETKTPIIPCPTFEDAQAQAKFYTKKYHVDAAIVEDGYAGFEVMALEDVNELKVLEQVNAE